MFQRANNMNCLKRQLHHHFTDTCSEYWLKHPVQVLQLHRQLDFDSRKSLQNKSQHHLSSALRRNFIRRCRLEDCGKDTLNDLYKSSISMQGDIISETVKKGVRHYGEQNCTYPQPHVAVGDIVQQITGSPLHQISASHSSALISSSLKHQVTAGHIVPQITSHQVTGGHFLPQITSHQDMAMHFLPSKLLKCSRWRNSIQRLYSTSILKEKHFLRTQILDISRVTSPVCLIDFSLSSFFGLKGIMRFYRGQTRKSVKQNTHSRGKYDGITGSIDSGSDRETESYALSPVGSQADDRNPDLTQEIMDGNDMKDQRDITTRRKPVDEMSLPELSRTSFNIVPYVKRSVTLQNLVKLGVSLDMVQRVSGVAEHLIKSNFDRDVVPLLKFLVHVGVETNMIGHIFTANPLLFMESVQDLEIRVGYLLHKNFSLREIASIISRSPVVLLMDPVMLDEKLGFFQDVFGLTDHEVRKVVKLYPRILPRKKELLTEVRFHIMEFIGFTNSEIKELILKDTKLFLSGKDNLVLNFDYLHNHMQISHEQILIWPQVLRKRLFIVKNRHMFLLSHNRAQYDPYKENYVSMQALADGKDEEFCQKVAKCPLQEFYDFCKTL